MFKHCNTSVCAIRFHENTCPELTRNSKECKWFDICHERWQHTRQKTMLTIYIHSQMWCDVIEHAPSRSSAWIEQCVLTNHSLDSTLSSWHYPAMYLSALVYILQSMSVCSYFAIQTLSCMYVSLRPSKDIHNTWLLKHPAVHTPESGTSWITANVRTCPFIPTGSCWCYPYEGWV